MEVIRQADTTKTVERVFVPGRLKQQWMAAAYERLVPIRRISQDQAGKVKADRIQEEYRWAL